MVAALRNYCKHDTTRNGKTSKDMLVASNLSVYALYNTHPNGVESFKVIHDPGSSPKETERIVPNSNIAVCR